MICNVLSKIWSPGEVKSQGKYVKSSIPGANGDQHPQHLGVLVWALLGSPAEEPHRLIETTPVQGHQDNIRALSQRLEIPGTLRRQGWTGQCHQCLQILDDREWCRGSLTDPSNVTVKNKMARAEVKTDGISWAKKGRTFRCEGSQRGEEIVDLFDRGSSVIGHPNLNCPWFWKSCACLSSRFLPKWMLVSFCLQWGFESPGGKTLSSSICCHEVALPETCTGEHWCDKAFSVIRWWACVKFWK